MIERIDNMQIKEFGFNSEEYRNELELRNKVLRKPLGMSLYDENLEADKNDVHIGAFINNRIVGVLILTILNSNELKMRQVAVDDDFRAMKIGTGMVRFAEEYSKKKGYSTMLLNARKTAVAFYEKLGYKKISGEFLEINIPHYKMSKSLL
jgi:ribosomal protein S18 acetylase RimI-like enzyme